MNFIAVDAGTVTVAPVCGLRPVRALRLVVLNEPKPGHATFSPFLVEATTRSKKAVSVRSASALVHSACFATSSMSSALVIVVSSSESEWCFKLSSKFTQLQAFKSLQMQLSHFFHSFSELSTDATQRLQHRCAHYSTLVTTRCGYEDFRAFAFV
ncbi:unannotated protein [freshwater metagenome]|uniref:Unannotated protein n=1 Tax=freshwater metagenome TaxID=449393 RepID=A0A6J6D9V3_9ZZZZ